MQIRATATDEFDVRVDAYEGPMSTTLVFSLEDEAAVLQILASAFRDARALQSGYSREEVEAMNKERSSGKT